MESRKETMQKEDWFRNVDDKIRSSDFPLDRSTAEDRLRGVNIEGENASRYFDKIDWPVRSREDLMDKLRSARMNR